MEADRSRSELKEVRRKAFEEVRNRFLRLEQTYGDALESNGYDIRLPDDRDRFLRDIEAFRRAADDFVIAARQFASNVK